MITIQNDDLNKFELSGDDLVSAIRYGRSLKAFKTNQLRAEATRMLERRLGLTQKQFAKLAKIKRLGLVRAQTRILVNELNVRYKVRSL